MMVTTYACRATLRLLAAAVILGATASILVPAPAVRQVVAVPMPTSPTWLTSLETMDRALAGRDINAAESAWRDAYGHAIRSRRWEGLLAVGEGAIRIRNTVVSRGGPYAARARKAWLSALFRARERRSLDGMLKVTEAFGTLGDTEVVFHALQMADAVAALDISGDARRRVLDLRKRLLPGTTRIDPPLAFQASDDPPMSASQAAERL